MSSGSLFRPNPSSGVPIYLQLMERVKHAVETGAIRPGDQLPGIRPLAEELVINPNTVAKAYRELEHEGVIELRHGAGAFVAANTRARKATTDRLRAAQVVVAAAVERLRAKDFDGTLLGIVDRVFATPRLPAPRVTFDFWYQFDAAEELEELRLDRPSIYKALPPA